MVATYDDGLHNIDDTINYVLACKTWRTVILDTPVLRDDGDLSRKGTEDLFVLSIIDRYLIGSVRRIYNFGRQVQSPFDLDTP